jgi:aspartate aminotransferase
MTCSSRRGTFYLWSRWPAGDPKLFWNTLADRDVFVMTDSIMNAPGYFRICLTASDEMVERTLPAFAAVGELATEPMRKAS